MWLQSPRALWVVIGLSLALNVTGIWWGVFEGSAHSWAVDEVNLRRLYRALSMKFAAGWHEPYPPLHFYALTTLYGPILALHALGVIDAGTGEASALAFLVGRSLSVLLATGALLTVYACARQLGLSERAGIIACLFTALSLPFVYYSKTQNLDVPYVFWFMLSVLFYVRALENHRLADYMLFAVAATFAVCTKDQAYGLYVLSVPYLWFSLYRSRRPVSGGPFLSDRRLWLPAIVALALFALVHNVAFNSTGFVAHITLITSARQGPDRVFDASTGGQLALGFMAFRQLGFSMGWPAFAICIGGILSALKRRQEKQRLLALLIPVVSYSIAFVSVVGYSYDRFWLPVIPILSLFGGWWGGQFLNGRRARGLRLVAGAAVLLFGFLRVAALDILLITDGRYRVQEWLVANVPRDARILTVGIKEYLPIVPSWQQRVHLPGDRVSIEVLEEVRPCFVITSSASGISRHSPGSPPFAFFDSLGQEASGYDLLLDYQTDPRIGFMIDPRGIGSNLDKINPRIQVFGRNDPRECRSLSNVM